MGFAGAMVVAMAIDIVVGWPAKVFARIGHPVTWLGALINCADQRWNHVDDTPAMRRAKGVAACLLTVATAVVPALMIQSALPSGWFGVVLLGIVAWPLIAARSLYDHVTAVAAPLERDDLVAARHAVSMIVGRDTSQLDEAGVARAAIESLAENASDGIVAPVFWGLLLGLPGIAAYKAINTLDSMIGHRTPRHEAFGWTSARIDDLANLVPARLTGLLFAAVSGALPSSIKCMLRDARHHRSPNAGWTEEAMAGALGVRLSGPRVYSDRIADEPWLNAKGGSGSVADLRRALRIYVLGMGALIGCLALGATLTAR